MPKRLTIKKVNQRLAEKFGEGLEIVRGEGYYYFSGKIAAYMPYTMLEGTPRLNDFTIEEIMIEAESRLRDSNWRTTLGTTLPNGWVMSISSWS